MRCATNPCHGVKNPFCDPQTHPYPSNAHLCLTSGAGNDVSREDVTCQRDKNVGNVLLQSGASRELTVSKPLKIDFLKRKKRQSPAFPPFFPTTIFLRAKLV